MPDTPLLSKFGFFSEVPPKTLDAIAAIRRVLNFAPQAVVFRSGEPAETLYALIEGEVELSIEVHDKTIQSDVKHEEAVHTRMVDHAREIVVDTVRPGQIFGWTALVGTGKRAVTARATKSMGIDAKAVFKVGRTILCPIIFHQTVPRPENAPTHEIIRNMPSFLPVHRVPPPFQRHQTKRATPN